ncbi:hypothetical protein V5O48_008396 [Marasmius crinis-equi]|uniref:Uncharacterized protein n=1 Tax=Marasmius crinis-equi TaxID=585013 RepID=A0ABR3FED3_9AGAR
MFIGTALTTDDKLAEYIVCIAKSQRTADMQGYAVRLSTFVANVCIAILMKWSKKSIEESVAVIMLQVYSTLISTVISMARHDLPVSDVHFALTLTISPLTMWILYSTYRFIRKRPSYLYDNIKSAHQNTIAILSVGMLLWWIVIDILIYSNDKECSVTFWGQLVLYKSFEVVLALIWAGPLFLVLLVMWLVYLIRHFGDIQGEYRRHMKKTVPWQRFRRIQLVARSIKSFWISQWDVITISHRWLPFYAILIYYVTWASALVVWAVDINKFFYDEIIVPFTHTTDSFVDKDFDPLGYGQVVFCRPFNIGPNADNIISPKLLAIAVAAEPLWTVCKLAVRKRMHIREWLLDQPQHTWNGVIFILTGRRDPWKKHLEALSRQAESVTGEKVVSLAAQSGDPTVKKSQAKTDFLDMRDSLDEDFPRRPPGLNSSEYIGYANQYPRQPHSRHQGLWSAPLFPYRSPNGGFPQYGAMV